MANKLISIVIPAFQEKANIRPIYQEINRVWENLKAKYDYELIFVNDGSQDQTWGEIKSLANEDSRVIGIDFSRNFGKELATTAGLNSVKGEACLIMDADLQHPPRYIPEFIAKWEQGDEVVIGIRESTKGISFLKKWTSGVYHWLMKQISAVEYIPKATDFRLLDKKVVTEFNKLHEHSRVTRNLIDWLGFKRSFIKFQADARLHGDVAYSYLSLIKLAFVSFVTHSLFPLKVAGYLGMLITFFSGSFGLFLFIDEIILNDPLDLNTAWVIKLSTLLLFLVGIILICLGLIGLYIGNIQNEVMNRHLYIIREKT